MIYEISISNLNGIQEVVIARKQDTLKKYHIAEFLSNIRNLNIKVYFNISKYKKLLKLL